MKNKDFKKILFRATFTMMAVDGDIHNSEISAIKYLIKNTPYFIDVDLDSELKFNIDILNKDKDNFISDFIEMIKNYDFSESQIITLIEVLIKIIKADNIVDPSELEFLRMVIDSLPITERQLIVKFPAYLDYFMNMKDLKINKTISHNFRKLNFE